MTTSEHYYTHEEYEAAKSVNLLDYLQDQGYELLRADRHNYMLKIHDSLKISEDGHSWIWYSRDVAGTSPVTLLQHLGFHNGEYIPIIKDLARYAEGKGYIIPRTLSDYEKQQQKELERFEKHTEFHLPKKNRNARRMFAYLIKERGIDPAIVSDLYFNKQLIYESQKYHNVVFKGQKDENGKVLYAGLRSTFNGKGSFKGDAAHSDKLYAFAMEGKSPLLIVGEAPIDLLSHATLAKLSGQDWEEDHRLSLCGLSDECLERYLKLHPEITTIEFCLDNDINGRNSKGEPENHGQIKAMELMEKYKARGYDVRNHIPLHKDLNEDLTYIKKYRQENKQTDKETCPREKALHKRITEAQQKTVRSNDTKTRKKELVH